MEVGDVERGSGGNKQQNNSSTSKKGEKSDNYKIGLHSNQRCSSSRNSNRSQSTRSSHKPATRGEAKGSAVRLPQSSALKKQQDFFKGFRSSHKRKSPGFADVGSEESDYNLKPSQDEGEIEGSAIKKMRLEESDEDASAMNSNELRDTVGDLAWSVANIDDVIKDTDPEEIPVWPPVDYKFNKEEISVWPPVDYKFNKEEISYWLADIPDVNKNTEPEEIPVWPPVDYKFNKDRDLKGYTQEMKEETLAKEKSLDWSLNPPLSSDEYNWEIINHYMLSGQVHYILRRHGPKTDFKQITRGEALKNPLSHYLVKNYEVYLFCKEGPIHIVKEEHQVFNMEKGAGGFCPPIDIATVDFIYSHGPYNFVQQNVRSKVDTGAYCTHVNPAILLNTRAESTGRAVYVNGSRTEKNCK